MKNAVLCAIYLYLCVLHYKSNLIKNFRFWLFPELRGITYCFCCLMNIYIALTPLNRKNDVTHQICLNFRMSSLIIHFYILIGLCLKVEMYLLIIIIISITCKSWMYIAVSIQHWVRNILKKNLKYLNLICLNDLFDIS